MVKRPQAFRSSCSVRCKRFAHCFLVHTFAPHESRVAAYRTCGTLARDSRCGCPLDHPGHLGRWPIPSHRALWVRLRRRRHHCGEPPSIKRRRRPLFTARRNIGLMEWRILRITLSDPLNISIPRLKQPAEVSLENEDVADAANPTKWRLEVEYVDHVGPQTRILE